MGGFDNNKIDLDSLQDSKIDEVITSKNRYGNNRS